MKRALVAVLVLAVLAAVAAVVVYVLPGNEPATLALEPPAHEPPPAREDTAERATAEAPARREEAREESDEAPVARESAATYEELSGASWTDLTQMDPPGRLTGIVLRGRTPVAGCTVKLWGDAVGKRPQGWGDAGPGAREARTQDDGRFVFEGLPHGRFTLRADDGDDHVEILNVQRHPDRQARSVLLLFGRATIAGVVFTPEGVAEPDVRVRVAGIGPEHQRAAFAFTDGEGRFEMTGLIAGRYHVICEPPGPRRPDSERLVTLPMEGRVTVRFGNPERAVRWTGRVVDPEGEVIEGGRGWFLLNAELGDERRVFTSDEGTFDVSLQPGSWAVHAVDGLYRGEELQAATELLQDTRRDVVLSGVLRLEPVEGSARLRADGFRLTGGDLRNARPPEELESDRLQWVNLKPGRYTLKPTNAAYRLDGMEPGQPLAVEITAEQPTVRLRAWRN